LSSQQVINIVRRQVAEGKELAEICELILDRCLSQDSSAQGGIGCDNMTLTIVALLGGRDKDAWYAWVKDRVEHNHGFPTPAGLPELYPHHRANYTPTPRANGVVSRGFGGGIAFYQGSASLFDANNTYSYDSSDSEPDTEQDDKNESKPGPSGSEQSDSSKSDADDGEANLAIGEDEEAISFTIHAPAAKHVDVVAPETARTEGDAAISVNGRRASDSDSDPDSVMTERSEEQDVPMEGVKPTDGTLLGSTAPMKTVGSPLIEEPKAVAGAPGGSAPTSSST